MTPDSFDLDRRTLLRGSALSALAAGLPAAASSAAPAFVRSGRPLLTHGVQAGDVREARAVLWCRADRPSRLVAQMSRDRPSGARSPSAGRW